MFGKKCKEGFYEGTSSLSHIIMFIKGFIPSSRLTQRNCVHVLKILKPLMRTNAEINAAKAMEFNLLWTNSDFLIPVSLQPIVVDLR